MTETLKPCPFCGGVPDGNCFYADQGDKWGRVVCGCGAQGPEVRTSYDVSEDAPWHDDAIAEWNTRAAPREPGEAERLARMESALKLAAKEFGRLWIAFDRGDSRRARVNELEQAMLDALAAPRPDAGDGTGEPTC